jgi:predicted ester cyclase
MAKTAMPDKMDQIRELVLRNVAAVNNHDLDAIAETAVTDLEVVGPDGTYKGRDRFMAELGTLTKAFPDYRFVMGDLIVEGDKVAYVARLEGTHLGPYQTADGRMVPPTGKRVVLQMVNVRYVRGGKIIKLVNSWDRLSLLAQLGLIPSPTAAE